MIDIEGIAAEIGNDLLHWVDYFLVLNRLPGYLTEAEAEAAADQIVTLLENATVVIEEN
jgi:hypothetical protein